MRAAIPTTSTTALHPVRHHIGLETGTLLPSEDGWSLVGPRGELLCRGLGLASRRQCLEKARELGITTVLS